jgi:hypothetical protein
MAKFSPDPDERILADRSRFSLQGGKVKFPVDCRCLITDRRFVYHDLGRMAPFYFQLGILLKLLIRGRPVSLPLGGLKLSRGTYARNRKLLRISSDQGGEILLDNFDKSLEWFRRTLEENGLGLVQTGEEEWRV